jgi:hypothetical protein
VARKTNNFGWLSSENERKNSMPLNQNFGRASSERERTNTMKPINAIKCLALGLGCLALVWASSPSKAGDTLPANAAAIRVTTGNTFALIPTADPNVFGHPVDGVAQVSLMGNCHFHGESTVYLPTAAGQPIRIISSSPWTLTSSDGANSLKFDAVGTATFDQANPLFVNLTYQATFVGGTGAFANARGQATMEVTAQFTSQLEGLANWTMTGFVVTAPPTRP